MLGATIALAFFAAFTAALYLQMLLSRCTESEPKPVWLWGEVSSKDHYQLHLRITLANPGRTPIYVKYIQARLIFEDRTYFKQARDLVVQEDDGIENKWKAIKPGNAATIRAAFDVHSSIFQGMEYLDVGYVSGRRLRKRSFKSVSAFWDNSGEASLNLPIRVKVRLFGFISIWRKYPYYELLPILSSPRPSLAQRLQQKKRNALRRRRST